MVRRWLAYALFLTVSSSVGCDTSSPAQDAAAPDSLLPDSAGKPALDVVDASAPDKIISAPDKIISAPDKYTGNCTNSGDCLPGGACDRVSAHNLGYGVCVPPSKVQVAATPSELTMAVTAITSGASPKTHILLTGKSYAVTIKAHKNNVSIIGQGAGQTVITPSGSGPPVTVAPGASLYLQQVKVSGSKEAGIRCGDGQSKLAFLMLIEAELAGNAGAGVMTRNCYASFRRNIIRKNQAGGMDLGAGSLFLTNNLIVENGTAGSSGGGFGGVLLAPSQTYSVTMSFNTVAYNKAAQAARRGIVCENSGISIANNIVYNGDTGAVTSGCIFQYSLVQGLNTGKGNINADPLFTANYALQTQPRSPCIDAGQTNSTTRVDLAGHPRPKIPGGKVDIGALEVE